MSDKAPCQKARSPEGCDENGPAAALLVGHVSIQICSFVAPCRRPILIATPLHQSLTWCTGGGDDDVCIWPPHNLNFRSRGSRFRARPRQNRWFSITFICCDCTCG